MESCRLTCSRSEQGHLPPLVVQLVIDIIIEEICSQRTGNLLSRVDVDAVGFLQMVFCADKSFIVLVYSFKAELLHGGGSIHCFHLLMSHRLHFIVRRQSQFTLQLHKFIPMRHGSLLATAYQRIDSLGRETDGAVWTRIDHHQEVGHCHILFNLVARAHTDIKAHHIEGCCHLVRIGFIAEETHADDIISTHLLGQIGRIIVLHTTVGQNHIAFSHWRKSGRYRHRCTHGLGKMTAMKIIFLIRNDIGGRTGKSTRQSVEVDAVTISFGQAIKERRQVLSSQHTCLGCLILRVDRHATAEEIGILHLEVVERLSFRIFLIREQEHPILRPHHRIYLHGSVAHAVESTDKAAYRCTRDDIHRDSGTLKNFQHTNMNHTLGPSSRETKSYLGAIVIRLGLCFSILG